MSCVLIGCHKLGGKMSLQFSRIVVCVAVGFGLPMLGLPSPSNATYSSQKSQQEVEPPTVKDAAAKEDAAKQDDATASKTKQEDEIPIPGLTYSDPVETKWKMNAIIKGGSGPANNMLITIPIPSNWPEQSVSIVEEDFPPNIARVAYRDLESGVRQLVASIPQIRPREEITISVTFVVATSQANAVADPTIFVRPKTNHRAGKSYLGVGPQINFRNSKLKKQVKEVVAGKDGIWKEIEGIFDWVRDNIEETPGDAKNVLDAFQDKIGCAEDKVGLFVAMCRAHKIPARIVWVEGFQRAEFMLVDEQTQPHWFPCSVAGIREFGSVTEPVIILQKGDSIRVPEKEGRQKLVAEFATCQGKSRPNVRFHRQVLSTDQ
ncbi:MAG: hypothetical protein ACI87E_005077 [Mariniblastus sp.]